MTQLYEHQIQALGSRERAALVNSISGFKAANLVGTVSADGNTNLAIMSSAVHLGSHPPLLALILRPDDACQHTLENILATRVYTLNHVNESIYAQAHQTAARYPRDVCEFEATGLRAQWEPNFAAPFVAEARIRMGMTLREHQKLTINGTQLIIGEVATLSYPQDSVNGDGSLDLASAGTVALSGLDSYYRAKRLGRMAYAKPELSPHHID